MKKTIYSGIQPTGIPHLGNYLGAIKPLVELSKSLRDKNCDFAFTSFEKKEKLIVSVADLHAMTVLNNFNPKTIYEQTLNTAIILYACGLRPEEIYVQSTVNVHAQLAYIFNCMVNMGELNRMTQYKSKSDNDNVSSGLFTYPNLMAADILSFKATLVPVGDDQSQHLELTNRIIKKFNKVTKTKFFEHVKPIIGKSGARIMSLKDPKKKMSKSDPSNIGKILLTDTDEIIHMKVKKATTDEFMLPDNIKELENRHGVRNLFNILSALTQEPVEKLVESIAGQGSIILKKMVAEKICDEFHNIRSIYTLMQNEDNKIFFKDKIKENGRILNQIANNNLNKINTALGIFCHN